MVFVVVGSGQHQLILKLSRMPKVGEKFIIQRGQVIWASSESAYNLVGEDYTILEINNGARVCMPWLSMRRTELLNL